MRITADVPPKESLPNARVWARIQGLELGIPGVRISFQVFGYEL